MEAKLGKAEKKAFRIANLLDDAADAIRKRSKRAYRAGEISLEEYIEARAKELELRAEVSVVVVTNLSEALNEASEAEKNIEQAILDAKARIKTVRSVKSGLEIVSALVSLAAAIAAGDVELIVKAGNSMAELT